MAIRSVSVEKVIGEMTVKISRYTQTDGAGERLIAALKFLAGLAPVDPGFGVEAPPPKPDQGLPPTSPGRPDQGLPGEQPGIDNSLPGGGGKPDQGLPGGGGKPDQGLPGNQPGIDNSLPIPPPLRPDNTLPGNQPGIDNSLPGDQPSIDNTLPGFIANNAEAIAKAVLSKCFECNTAAPVKK